MPPDLEIVREWLQRAGQDLTLAEMASPDARVTELACFHCQQAVEKALKGFLELREVPPPKTHALAELFDRVTELDPEFDKLRDTEWLSLYAVAGRYPGFEIETTVARAGEAVHAARTVLEFVTQRLPKEVRP